MIKTEEFSNANSIVDTNVKKRIGDMVSEVIMELRLCQSRLEGVDHNSRYLLQTKVDPRYGRIIGLILDRAIMSLGVPYYTNPRSSTYIGVDFKYSFYYFADEIMLNEPNILTLETRYNYSSENLEKFFSELVPAVNRVVKELSQGWVKTSTNCYENAETYGPSYQAILKDLAIHLNLMDGEKIEDGNFLAISYWQGISGGFICPYKLSIKGKEELIDKLISAIYSELSIKPNQLRFTHTTVDASNVAVGKSSNFFASVNNKGGIKTHGSIFKGIVKISADGVGTFASAENAYVDEGSSLHISASNNL